MQAAEHGATFTKARQLRDSMTKEQLREFAANTESHAYNWRREGNLKRGKR